ncbi:hypothetical protein GJAV_G00192380 [Gymnothorax javanicus]|nr:hypothetical protein GJAV_G00192380 [Gymnothorax javanicus]
MSVKFGNSAPAPLAIVFSGSGFLVAYQLGVIQCLLRMAPEVVEGASRVFGASAGSLAAAVAVCRINVDDCLEEAIKLTHSLSRRMVGLLHPNADLGQGIERALHRMLPENAHALASGRLQITVTRMSDGKQVVISEFHCREDVIQYYVDGGFSVLQPPKDHKILTVSPFSGEADICPHDDIQTPYHLIISGMAYKLTMTNYSRMINALFFPTQAKLLEAYNSGYKDAHLFLQRNDLIEHRASSVNDMLPVEARSERSMESRILAEDEEDERQDEEQEWDREQEGREGPTTAPEEEQGKRGYSSDGLDSSSWTTNSLEETIYLSLPGWVRAALLCNLMAHIGLVGLQDIFLARLISYLLLPYTLPTCIIFDFARRLLLRVRHIMEGIYWLWQDLKHILLLLTNTAVSSLKRNLTDRFSPPSFQLTPTLEFQSEDDDEDEPKKLTRVRRRSTLRVQLSGMAASSSSSTSSDPHSHPQPNPDALAFSFLFDLGVEVDSKPDIPTGHRPHPLGSSPSSEVEDGSSPTSPRIPAGDGGEGE